MSKYNPAVRQRWYRKNKDRLNAAARARYPLQLEQQREWRRASRLRHRTERLVREKEYRETNRERIRVYGRSRLRSPALLLARARRRAKLRNLPCTITIDDIEAVYGTCCPVFGLPWGEARQLAPSLDCIIPDRGYVPGNIAVISMRANTMKSDAGLTEIEHLARWMRTQVVPL